MNRNSLTNEKIKTLKIGLYQLLISIESDDLTPNEIDLQYYLSRDKDIKEVVNNEFRKIKKES